jgi:hypothetical protein
VSGPALQISRAAFCVVSARISLVMCFLYFFLAVRRIHGALEIDTIRASRMKGQNIKKGQENGGV